MRVVDAAAVGADVAWVDSADGQPQQAGGLLVHADALAGEQLLVVAEPGTVLVLVPYVGIVVWT